ncbi:uncharacterized protein [Aristolochia californica]|uniref:uncharacterized protein n=1 Tax=Aristolochia californica TaxID=171875 RepID=UPI0035DBC38D
MDWIKVEALKYKEAAEQKIRSKDYVGARDMMHKAIQHFPDLENASQILSVCNILCASEMVLPGCGLDWYWVLQLPQTASNDIIRGKHQKLSSILEAVKNKFPGTETALGYITDASFVLLDQVKRLEFDLKRNAGRNGLAHLNSEAQRVGEIMVEEMLSTSNNTHTLTLGKRPIDGTDRSNETSVLSELPLQISRDFIMDERVDDISRLAGSGLLPEPNDKGDKTTTQEVTTQKKPKRIGHKPKESEGAQICHIVSDVGPPLLPKPVTSKAVNPDFYNFENNRKTNMFVVGQVWAAYDKDRLPRRYAQIGKVIPLPFKVCVTWLNPDLLSPSEKKWFDAGLPVSSGPFFLEGSNMAMAPCNHMVFSHVVSYGSGKELLEIYPKKGDIWAIYRNWDIEEWSCNPERKEACEFEMVEILSSYSKAAGVKVAYLEKVEGFKRVYHRYTNKESEVCFQIPRKKLYMFSHSVPAVRYTGPPMNGVVEGMWELDPLSVPENVVAENISLAASASREMVHHVNESNCIDRSNPSLAPLTTTAIVDNGSDLDIQYYKRKWSAKNFSEDQIWAISDGSDEMPRLYVKVNNVSAPSKVSVTYLEPHPMHDDEIQWVEENLPFVCGIFRASRVTVDLEMPKFSHLMKCERSVKKSFYKIYPKEGEIWAVYRKWQRNWKLSDHKNSEIQVVEILSDFVEEVGVRISSLVQVNGCVTFFQRQLYEGFQLSRTIPKTEMLSFSHRIPAYNVPGVEAYGIPKSSWHLEADSLPLHFYKKSFKESVM